MHLTLIEPKSWQGRAGQGRAGQGRAGQGRAGQGRAGQGRAGQGRAGQGRDRGTSIDQRGNDLQNKEGRWYWKHCLVEK